MNGPAPSSASPNRAAAPTSVRSSIAPRPATSCKFVASIVAAFLAVLLPVIVHHQMWRNELDGWTWALESPSLAALLHLVPYEGHPPLFFMLLYALTRVTANPLAMKLLHAGLAAATVAVVAAKAPWPPWRAACCLHLDISRCSSLASSAATMSWACCSGSSPARSSAGDGPGRSRWRSCWC